MAITLENLAATLHPTRGEERAIIERLAHMQPGRIDVTFERTEDKVLTMIVQNGKEAVRHIITPPDTLIDESDYVVPQPGDKMKIFTYRTHADGKIHTSISAMSRGYYRRLKEQGKL